MARKITARRLLVVVGLAILLCIGFLANRIGQPTRRVAYRKPQPPRSRGRMSTRAQLESVHPKAWVVTFSGQWHAHRGDPWGRYSKVVASNPAGATSWFWRCEPRQCRL